MTRKEKRLLIEAESRFFLFFGTHPTISYLKVSITGMLIGASGQYWEIALKVLFVSLFISLFLSIAYVILTDWIHLQISSTIKPLEIFIGWKIWVLDWLLH